MIGYTLVVQVLGGLFLLDLLACLPFFREAFAYGDRAGERAGEWKRWVLGMAWTVGAGLLISGTPQLFLAGAVILWAVFRREFVGKRWRTVRRGFGAPGFMSNFMVQYLILFEIARCLSPGGGLSDLALMVFRVELGVIMICAGVYKGLVGFYRGEGMEYGTVNPMWGYAWEPLRRVAPNSLFFRMNNVAGSGIEIIAGILLILPLTQGIGALLVTLSFLYVGMLVRLGRLAVLMAVIPAFCLPSVVEAARVAEPAIQPDFPGWASTIVFILLWCYLGLLPMVKFMQYFNLFGNRQLPEPWQKWLSIYANAVPIIMWRVFTPDVTNFFVRIRGWVTEGELPRELLNESTYRISDWRSGLAKLRFWHVGESIALVSIFTLRKYYPSRPELFRERLIDYADSLRGAFGQDLRWVEFECVAICKTPREFVFEAVRRFCVDIEGGRVEEADLGPNDPTVRPARFSPVREAVAPGTYLKRSKNNP